MSKVKKHPIKQTVRTNSTPFNSNKSPFCIIAIVLNYIEKLNTNKKHLTKATNRINHTINIFKFSYMNTNDQSVIDGFLDRLNVIMKEKKVLSKQQQKLENELKKQLKILLSIKKPTNEDLEMIQAIKTALVDVQDVKNDLEKSVF